MQKEDEAYKMCLYIKELTINCEEGQGHRLKCEIDLQKFTVFVKHKYGIYTNPDICVNAVA